MRNATYNQIFIHLVSITYGRLNKKMHSGFNLANIDRRKILILRDKYIYIKHRKHRIKGMEPSFEATAPPDLGTIGIYYTNVKKKLNYLHLFSPKIIWITIIFFGMNAMNLRPNNKIVLGKSKHHLGL